MAGRVAVRVVRLYEVAVVRAGTCHTWSTGSGVVKILRSAVLRVRLGYQATYPVVKKGPSLLRSSLCILSDGHTTVDDTADRSRVVRVLRPVARLRATLGTRATSTARCDLAHGCQSAQTVIFHLAAFGILARRGRSGGDDDIVFRASWRVGVG